MDLLDSESTVRFTLVQFVAFFRILSFDAFLSVLLAH
jgi:hypothetical protein